jgi:hypothetical protein
MLIECIGTKLGGCRHLDPAVGRGSGEDSATHGSKAVSPICDVWRFYIERVRFIL